MIKLAVFDFDGVFTDNRTMFDNEGNPIKHYCGKDVPGIHKLQKQGIEVGVISGWKENKSQRAILEHFNISRISLGAHNKPDVLKTWCKELGVEPHEVSYIGDDLNDLEIMKMVGIVGCPQDAVNEVKKISQYICSKNGGHGAIREFCEFLLQNTIKVSGLICVKYTSTRLPFKNFRKFGNETLLDIKIKKLLSLSFLNEVVVNTESDFIIDYVKARYTDKRLRIVKRNPLFSKDSTDNSDFVVNVCNDCYEYVLYSPVTMPFIEENTYNNMFNKLNDGYDSIILAADGKQGAGHKYEKHKLCFGASLMKRDDVFKYKDFIGMNPYFIETNSKERIDIDVPDEFNIALYHYFNKDSIYGCENQHSLNINTIYKLDETSNIDRFISSDKKEPNVKTKVVEIMDVTVRDGGFSNNWDFKDDHVEDMMKTASDSGISYFEIGYMCNEDVIKANDGHYRNVSIDKINHMVRKIQPKCKISTLFDAWRYDVNKLPTKQKTSIDLIRIVTYMEDEKLLSALELCKKIKEKGYEVSINVMCASYFTADVLENIKKRVTEYIDYLDFVYFADTYGGMEPDDVTRVFEYINCIKKLKSEIKIGFHIHNNGQTGMSNFIASLKHVDIVDASYEGMGRGSGNVCLENVYLFLKIKRNYSFNITPFLDYADKYFRPDKIDDVGTTLVGFLNVHPYRDTRKQQNMTLNEFYTYLNSLTAGQKYHYID